MDRKVTGCEVWTEFNWFKTGTSGRLLWTRQWTFRFHKRRENSWLFVFMAGSNKIPFPGV